jgi:hypothetical protein
VSFKKFDVEFRAFVVKSIAPSIMGWLMGAMVINCCLRLGRLRLDMLLLDVFLNQGRLGNCLVTWS